MMKALQSSETTGITRPMTRHHIPEDLVPQKLNSTLYVPYPCIKEYLYYVVNQQTPWP